MGTQFCILVVYEGSRKSGKGSNGERFDIMAASWHSGVWKVREVTLYYYPTGEFPTLPHFAFREFEKMSI
jgi:hypothetical protein